MGVESRVSNKLVLRRAVKEAGVGVPVGGVGAGEGDNRRRFRATKGGMIRDEIEPHYGANVQYIAPPQYRRNSSSTMR